MLTVSQIVAALKTTRAEFARLYLQAQSEVAAGTRITFEAVGLDPDDARAFEAALLHAQVKGWMTDLLYLVVSQSMESGALTRSLIEDHGEAELQAMTNRVRGFGQPDVVHRGMADAMRWTAKVLVDGAPKGTGFLIRPNLLLTAWHVLAPAFTQKNEGGQLTWEPDPGAASRMRFEFDDVQRLVGRNRTLQHQGSLTVKAAKNWHVRSSACHRDELLETLPADRKELDGHWDYVIVRLESTIGLERRWGLLDERAVIPKAQNSIMVLQHAAGQSLRYDEYEIGGPTDFDPPTGRFPDIRFIHFANAVGGSSGGPCFDRTFSVFGIHQGRWPNGTSNGRVANRGVPITRILKHIAAGGDLPNPDPDEVPVWQLGEAEQNAPVLGREDFQRLIWRAALTDRPRIVLIDGVDGSGKSFLLKVLQEMLRDPQHLKVEIPAEAISKADTAAFVAQICKLAGIPPLQLAFAQDVNSTTAVYRKDEVIARLIEALEQARGMRKVWILLRDLNKVEITGQDARELLLLLYSQTLSSSWLRIVLDGFEGDMPAEAAAVTETCLTSPIEQADIERYYKRLSAEYDLNIEDKVAKAHGKVMSARYAGIENGVRRTRVRELAQEVLTYALEYVGG